eukprot:3237082-Prymnesium_polylepis.2
MRRAARALASSCPPIHQGFVRSSGCVFLFRHLAAVLHDEAQLAAIRLDVERATFSAVQPAGDWRAFLSSRSSSEPACQLP